MRLWRVVILLNLALGAGLFLGYILWGRPLARLAPAQSATRQSPTPPGIEQAFSARGVVRGVIPEIGVIVITHEDIAGFMPAMTMGFSTSDPALLSAVETGDIVRFTLRGVPPKLTITGLTREGQS
jgi:Cu/Ag efflux protein CusF